MKAIAAMSLNRVIGRDNKIPWHLPEDFKWFKQLTTGQVVVMGRRTFESIGRPLPHRETIVLSKTARSLPGVRIIASLDELDLQHEDRDVFICGGAEVYRTALPRCSDIYLTILDREFEGDVFLPEFEDQFDLVETIREGPDFRIVRYQNRSLDGSPCGPASG